MSTLQDILTSAGGTTGENLHAIRRRSLRLLRPGRTPAGVVVALTASLALSAATGATVGLVTGSSFGRMPYRQLAAWAGTAKWSDSGPLAVALAATVAGVVMLALAALPGRTRLVPLESADPRLVMGMTRSGLRRTLRAAARSVDEVDRARVRLGWRNVEITVVSDTDRTGVLLRQVGAAVGDRMASLGALCGGEVVVRLRRRGI
ncbi:hypothetical protein FHR32_004581 [Streptosporangium album]|uniref:DUF6286 domain-containing protein n=1 Tax=Streptosporangium album TaxID=47479 RepID=A0A7W7WAS5_9ACTN|nr:DUF6286 domain-containing protein [Streptosporangium album]MBB4940276.1 hypothetical protein [Streptosporangium album]